MLLSSETAVNQAHRIRAQDARLAKPDRLLRRIAKPFMHQEAFLLGALGLLSNKWMQTTV